MRCDDGSCNALHNERNMAFCQCVSAPPPSVISVYITLSIKRAPSLLFVSFFPELMEH